MFKLNLKMWLGQNSPQTFKKCNILRRMKLTYRPIPIKIYALKPFFPLFDESIDFRNLLTNPSDTNILFATTPGV